MKNKIICFIIGHKSKDFTDSGYQICDRCESHEYYDEGFASWGYTLPDYLWQLKFDFKWFIRHKIYGKCKDCGKIQFICGRFVGNHNQCLPF